MRLTTGDRKNKRRSGENFGWFCPFVGERAFAIIECQYRVTLASSHLTGKHDVDGCRPGGLRQQRLYLFRGDRRVFEYGLTIAGLRCVMTVNGYTEKEDNSEATLVVSSLGDPDGERTRVIANRGSASPGNYITLADLERCLAP